MSKERADQFVQVVKSSTDNLVRLMLASSVNTKAQSIDYYKLDCLAEALPNAHLASILLHEVNYAENVTHRERLAT